LPRRRSENYIFFNKVGFLMVNILQSSALAQYCIKSAGSPPLQNNCASGHAKVTSVKDESPYIHISQEAMNLLAQENKLSRVTEFLRSQGQELFQKVFHGIISYPESLASKLDDDSLTNKEHGEIQNAITEREYSAFSKYAKQSPADLKMYYLNYIKYLDSLSPEEQQSSRYAGQREAAVTAYESAARGQGEEPEDLSLRRSPISLLLELISVEELGFDALPVIREKFTDQIELINKDSNCIGEYDRILAYYDAIT